MRRFWKEESEVSVCQRCSKVGEKVMSLRCGLRCESGRNVFWYYEVDMLVLNSQYWACEKLGRIV